MFLSVRLLVNAASSSKKIWSPTTPHSSAVGKRITVPTPKARAMSSQRGRRRRGRVTQPQTPLSGQSTAIEQLVTPSTGHLVSVASRSPAQISQLRGCFTFFMLLVVLHISLRKFSVSYEP